METRGLFQRLYVVTEWITRISLSNVIWLLFNLPIVYLAFNVFVSTTPEQVIANVLLIGILAPFLFFPATTALFGVARKWVQGELGVKIVRSFWKYYRENYLRSMLGGFVIIVLWFLLVVDYYYFSTMKSPLFYLFLVVGMFIIVFTVNFFAITVHFEAKLFHTLKNSFLLALGRPVHTIGIAAICVAVYYVSFNVLPFLILLGMGSIIAYGTFYIFQKAVF
ncbi:DUF624 domain-containing protein [Caldibacillus lycopersici]|uniref:DUF624 domain-containing protein n=1 Tax=Perspicuibacillus lycopersici TaxID=1325689 RepID=A0AAE3ISY5_9BACI|nr:DUF624 domain-containing protein [Perspicuibacillus lycopersici]MCU9613068.1 DUF624 domain-containing protein [Perspicuibacillus lycopersici]